MAARQMKHLKEIAEAGEKNVYAYAVTEVALLLGVSRQLIYKMINDGSLNAFNVGEEHARPKVRITAAELIRFVNENPVTEKLSY